MACYKKAFIIRFFLIVCTLGIVFLGNVPTAWACGACTNCSQWQQQITQEMNKFKQWMSGEWWNQNVKPAMQSYTDDSRNVFITEALAIGAFLDGENMLGSLRAMQELNAESMKNYQVSEAICKFGTLSRSLAASESKAKATRAVLAQRLQARQIGRTGMANAGKGSQEDKADRYKLFTSTECTPSSYGGGMDGICTATGGQNRDINFTKLMNNGGTLNFGADNLGAAGSDLGSLSLLSDNLYGNDVMEQINYGELKKDSVNDFQSNFLDQRSIVAKRSVAANSFFTIASQKSQGGSGSAAFMGQVLSGLGLNSAAIASSLGSNPSYDAQMEILTKRLYQDPSFYVNLMDTPANVERQYAALQAFGLMQRRDIFETVLRSEMLLSTILEIEISDYQDEVQSEQNAK